MKFKFNQENKYTLNPRSNKKEKKKKNWNETLPTVSKDSQAKVRSVTPDELNSKLTENFCWNLFCVTLKLGVITRDSEFPRFAFLSWLKSTVN